MSTWLATAARNLKAKFNEKYDPEVVSRAEMENLRSCNIVTPQILKFAGIESPDMSTMGAANLAQLPAPDDETKVSLIWMDCAIEGVNNTGHTYVALAWKEGGSTYWSHFMSYAAMDKDWTTSILNFIDKPEWWQQKPQSAFLNGMTASGQYSGADLKKLYQDHFTLPGGANEEFCRLDMEDAKTYTFKPSGHVAGIMDKATLFA